MALCSPRLPLPRSFFKLGGSHLLLPKGKVFLVVLHARDRVGKLVSSNNTSRAALLAKVFYFLCACTREVAQTAPSLFVDVARKAKELALTVLNLPKSAIIPLRNSVLKLQYFPEDLTPLHGDLFQVLL